jgi:hypothetical protein
VFATSKALCAWLLPEMRDAWADWPWWQMRDRKFVIGNSIGVGGV